MTPIYTRHKHYIDKFVKTILAKLIVGKLIRSHVIFCLGTTKSAAKAAESIHSVRSNE